MFHVLTSLCIGMIAAVALASGRAYAAPERKHTPLQLQWDHKIAMRDGVRLSATIYRDPKQAERVPAIVMITPYVGSTVFGTRQGVYFAARGYVFVAVDTRGRGNSEGTFVPGQVEAKDGYDVVEWAAKQPWCNGKVATIGGSWLGFTQWSLAKEFPPHLAAIAPTASVYPGVDYPQPNGMFTSYVLRWLNYVDGRTLNQGLFDAADFWTNAEWARITRGLPFADLDKVSGANGAVFRTWLAHPREDAFWKALTPRPADYEKLRSPVLTITGYYDGDQLGALTYYERHMAHGAADAKARHWLVLGPWDHIGTRIPNPELGGLSFGPGAKQNMEQLHVDWYDHVLKGGPVPALLSDRVVFFVMGRNTWHSVPELRQLESAPLTLALDASGVVPGEVMRSGGLVAAAPGARASVVLTADPRYLPPREQLDAENPFFLRDQRDAHLGLPNQAFWHSAAFSAETVLAGRPRLTLNVAVDQPDADLFASLHEVLPDGTAIMLSQTWVRLRYRKGGIQPVLMTPGKPERVELPPFRMFVRAIGKAAGSASRSTPDRGSACSAIATPAEISRPSRRRKRGSRRSRSLPAVIQGARSRCRALSPVSSSGSLRPPSSRAEIAKRRAPPHGGARRLVPLR